MSPSELCKNHQTTFYSVCAFYVLAVLTIIGYMVANNNRAIAAEVTISADLAAAKIIAQKEHAEMMEKVTSRMNDGFTEIRQRLSRMEAKIEKM